MKRIPSIAQVGCDFSFDTSDPYGERQNINVELVLFGQWMNKVIESSKLVCSTQSTE